MSESLASVGGRCHGLANPTRSFSIRTVAATVKCNESSGPLFQFWSNQRVTNPQIVGLHAKVDEKVYKMFRTILQAIKNLR